MTTTSLSRYASLTLLTASIAVPHPLATVFAQNTAATAVKNQGKGLQDVGSTAATGTGAVGRRLEATDGMARSNPARRLSTRINNRVQNRLSNRLDRDYNSEIEPTPAFESAASQARILIRPR